MEKTIMKKIKLLTILAATITATSAFADCMMPATPSEAIQCAVTDFSTSQANIKSMADEVYFTNQAVGNSIYQYFNDKGRGSFNFNALAQSVYYGAAVYKTTGPDLVNIGKAGTSGNIDSLPGLISKFQADRAALVAPGSKTEFAAKATVYAQIELFAKAQLANGGAKNNQAKIDNYAADMYAAFLAPVSVINLEQFIKYQAPKYIGATMNTMTQELCEAQVMTAQQNIAVARDTDAKVDYLLELGKPGSFQKQMLKAANMSYASDALDIIYTYATGMNSEKKNVKFNICDYNAFLATKDSNMYSKMLNDVVVTASAKAGISAEKAYWGLTAISAIALNNSFFKQAPVAGAGILPY